MSVRYLKITYPKVFGVADNEFEISFEKFRIAEPILPFLYLRSVSIFIQLSNLKKMASAFFETLIIYARPYV